MQVVRSIEIKVGIGSDEGENSDDYYTEVVFKRVAEHGCAVDMAGAVKFLEGVIEGVK